MSIPLLWQQPAVQLMAAQRATSMLVKPLADGSGSVAEEGAREIVRAGHRVLGEVIKRTWPPADP